jgi:hypothetical protein
VIAPQAAIGWTFERLEEEGLSPTVLDALRLVTKRPEDEGDSEAVYVAFVRRAKGNKSRARSKRPTSLTT